jgi:hypothetical protein
MHTVLTVVAIAIGAWLVWLLCTMPDDSQGGD